MTEDVIAQGLEESKTWIRESIELQRELVAKVGVRPPLSYVPQVDYGPDVVARVDEVGRDRLTKMTTITQKAERDQATDEATKAIMAELARSSKVGRKRSRRPSVR